MEDKIIKINDIFENKMNDKPINYMNLVNKISRQMDVKKIDGDFEEESLDVIIDILDIHWYGE